MRQEVWDAVGRLARLKEERYARETTWLRQLLVLAGGALALLAGLGPDKPPDGLAQYFLVATWPGLAIAIVSGVAATYRPVSRAKEIAKIYQSTVATSVVLDILIGTRGTEFESYRDCAGAKNREEKLDQLLNTEPDPRPTPLDRFLDLCKPVMIVSLLVAVLCLAAYGIITTLGI